MVNLASRATSRVSSRKLDLLVRSIDALYLQPLSAVQSNVMRCSMNLQVPVYYRVADHFSRLENERLCIIPKF
jgi:hypothetical protein